MAKAHWLSPTQKKKPFEIRQLTAGSYSVDPEFHLFLDDLLQVLFPIWCFTRCYHFYTERLRKHRAKHGIQYGVGRGKEPFGRRQKIKPGWVPRIVEPNSSCLHGGVAGAAWARSCDASQHLSSPGPSGHRCGTQWDATRHQICIWCCRGGRHTETQSHLPMQARMKLAGSLP